MWSFSSSGSNHGNGWCNETQPSDLVFCILKTQGFNSVRFNCGTTLTKVHILLFVLFLHASVGKFGTSSNLGNIKRICMGQNWWRARLTLQPYILF